MTKFSLRFASAAALALSGSGAMAASIALDTGNPSNGLYDIYSATFDGALAPCTGGSPSYCSFFGGDAPAGRQITISPTPTGVINGVPIGITPVPVSGSFLDVTLSGGNTLATLNSGVVALPSISLTISGSTFVNASGAGFTFLAPSTATAVNGSGQVEFLVNAAPANAVDFTTLSTAVTSCTGPFCGLIPILSLDMVRYRVFLDFDPTFTSFTGNLIGQTGNNSLVYANLNSAVVPLPAAGWLLLTAVGGLAARRLKRAA